MAPNEDTCLAVWIISPARCLVRAAVPLVLACGVLAGGLKAQATVGQIIPSLENKSNVPQCKLGIYYATGQGVPKDEVAAAGWFRKAAGQNFAPAQICLGACFANGLGVAQDFVEAYQWLLLAAVQREGKTTDNAGLLELGLSSTQIAEGKRRTENFKPLERSQP